MTPTFTIRPARVEELADVERMVLTSFPHLFQPLFGPLPVAQQIEIMMTLRRTRVDPTAGLFVAVDEGEQVVGTMAFEHAALHTEVTPERLRAVMSLGLRAAIRFAFVSNFVLIKERPAADEFIIRSGAVLPAWRRHGVAARLIQRIEEEAVGEGFREYVGWVALTNPASQALMLSNGYAIGRHKRYLLRGWIANEPAMIRFYKAVP